MGRVWVDDAIPLPSGPERPRQVAQVTASTCRCRSSRRRPPISGAPPHGSSDHLDLEPRQGPTGQVRPPEGSGGGACGRVPRGGPRRSGRRLDDRCRRRQLPAPRWCPDRLAGGARRRALVRVREGDRGHHLHQPLLRVGLAGRRRGRAATAAPTTSPGRPCRSARRSTRPASSSPGPASMTGGGGPARSARPRVDRRPRPEPTSPTGPGPGWVRCSASPARPRSSTPATTSGATTSGNPTDIGANYRLWLPSYPDDPNSTTFRPLVPAGWAQLDVLAVLERRNGARNPGSLDGTPRSTSTASAATPANLGGPRRQRRRRGQPVRQPRVGDPAAGHGPLQGWTIDPDTTGCRRRARLRRRRTGRGRPPRTRPAPTWARPIPVGAPSHGFAV